MNKPQPNFCKIGSIDKNKSWINEIKDNQEQRTLN
jgi:hypothetical protein